MNPALCQRVQSCRTPVAFQSARGGRSVQCCASKLDEAERSIKGALLGLAACVTLLGAPIIAPAPLAPHAEARLTAGGPVTNARAILRYALPIDNKAMAEVQKNLESISEALRIPGSKSLTPIAKSVRNAENILKKQNSNIIAAFASDKKADGLLALAALDKALLEFDSVIENKDKQEVPIIQQKALYQVGLVQEAMVKGFPFEVPAEYANLPQLKGRATLEMSFTLASTRETGNPQTKSMLIVLDGYNAPVSAGCFMDLVQKKWYDGMEIQRADGFVVQTGKPPGKNEFYVENGKPRLIPLEVRVEGEKEPIYEITLEDLGRPNAQPALAFNAFGTLAWARGEFDTNSASSQVFWLLKESELTPSGANLLDGRYSVFGYVVEGQEDLLDMKVGDKINYIKVLAGGENFLAPKM